MILLEILNPIDKSEAGLILAVMMIVSLIIGFVTGWVLKGLRSGDVNVNIDGLNAEIDQLKTKVTSLDKSNLDLTVKNNSLQTDLEAWHSRKVSISQVEADAVSISAEHQANAEKLGFNAVSGDNRDDLTMIHGVGPFIEKKLNHLGIYTFDQISGFNVETINKVTDAIEFFPGRIERDNWVDQAKDLKD